MGLAGYEQDSDLDITQLKKLLKEALQEIAERNEGNSLFDIRFGTKC